MNNTFSLHRVALYARKHYVENSRSYLFGLLGLVAMSSLALYYFNSSIAEPISLILIFCWIYFTQVSSQSHYALGSIERSYTLPSTSAEKYLFIWLNSAVLIPLLSTAIVLILSFIFSTIQQKTIGLSISEIDAEGTALLLLFQATTLLCCCGVKSTPIKGYAILAGIIIGSLLLYNVITHYLIPGYNYDIRITDSFCDAYIGSARINYPILKYVSDGFNIDLAMKIWVAVLWITAYFKFKERTLK